MMQNKKVMLAPMAGVTDAPFRLLCFEQGCDAAVTEMVSAPGLLYSPSERFAYKQLLAVLPGEGEVIAQLFGHDARQMGDAARMLTDMGLFCGIDINMGCPAHKVTGGGSGSALMKTPALAEQIIKSTALATYLPVTVKMRIGWDDAHINAVEMARIAQDAGARALTVHGRTRAQQYAGRADRAAIARVKQAVRIPVYANGDIYTAQDALDMLNETGCDGVAVARGAMGNPWLFAQIKQALAGQSVTTPSAREVVDTALRHAEMMCALKTEPYAMREMRKHFAWYTTGRRNAASLRRQLNAVQTLAQARDILYQFFLNTGDEAV